MIVPDPDLYFNFDFVHQKTHMIVAFYTLVFYKSYDGCKLEENPCMIP